MKTFAGPLSAAVPLAHSRFAYRLVAESRPAATTHIAPVKLLDANEESAG